MGQTSSRAGGGGASPAVQTAVTPQVQVQPVDNAVSNATAMTDTEADQIRKAEDAAYDATTQAAIKMYISNTDFDHQGHSMSQTMNYLLDNGVDFDQVDQAELKKINKQYGLNLTMGDVASMQYTDSRITSSAHKLGKDTILQRGAHDDLLRQQFGISDYSKMTEAQLQKALVGKAFATTSHMSTSYDINKNPFLGSGSGVSGGREVVYRIKAGKNTNVVLGAKKQSEIVVTKGTAFKITGVRYTGKTATPRSGSSKRQIEVDIETF